LLQLANALFVAGVHHPTPHLSRLHQADPDEDRHLLIERRLRASKMLEQRLRGDAEWSAVFRARPVERRRILEQLKDTQSRWTRECPKSLHQLHVDAPRSSESTDILE